MRGCACGRLLLRKLAHAIYREIFSYKNLKNHPKKKTEDNFHIFAQKVDCGYTLELISARMLAENML